MRASAPLARALGSRSEFPRFLMSRNTYSGAYSLPGAVGTPRARARARGFQGKPMFSLSADMTIANWTLEQILRTRIWSRSTYAATTGSATAILAHFGPALDNPYKRRR